jgi:cell division protein FtsW (lipid II flippase)
MQIDSTASAGRKTHRERKLSGGQKSAREIPSRRGEIIAIVTAIELGFIGIIIITSTFITVITTPSRYNILG